MPLVTTLTVKTGPQTATPAPRAAQCVPRAILAAPMPAVALQAAVGVLLGGGAAREVLGRQLSQPDSATSSQLCPRAPISYNTYASSTGGPFTRQADSAANRSHDVFYPF